MSFLCYNILKHTKLCLKSIFPLSAREKSKAVDKEYEKAENDLKALQSVGQVVGDVLKQLTEDHCRFPSTYT